MKIEKDRVVLFHYSVNEPGTPALESSHNGNGKPMAVLMGHGNIIPGLETALEGREAGERFNVTVGPAEAYGERREGLTQRVARKHFKNAKLFNGMQVVLPTEMGPRAMTVTKVGMSVVDVDLNHPMAGKTLEFDVEIVEVREAQAEELAHGHVHGDGGVEH
jgi:FKBP-type peptidyl-prolyl cis-trans isomerase SlyD